MDINLPGMSGFEARQAARARWPETRAHPGDRADRRGAAEATPRARSEAGFYRYLTKPVKVDELTRVARRAAGEGLTSLAGGATYWRVDASYEYSRPSSACGAR